MSLTFLKYPLVLLAACCAFAALQPSLASANNGEDCPEGPYINCADDDDSGDSGGVDTDTDTSPTDTDTTSPTTDIDAEDTDADAENEKGLGSGLGVVASIWKAVKIVAKAVWTGKA